MDFNSLKDQVSNLTLYDLKAGVRKVQNAVMNYTEMEAKVREATNNEPWGASSSTMQEIANGTYNYSLLNEIMPMIYKRFTEKTAEEWRQIYKGLQLLEFLVKNGSERVIDDARSHLSLLKMLRQFHFIDQNGKDQGINVRNRAKELADLLGDVDRIRAERKKARSTRSKYTGVEGGAGLGGMSGGGGRYGGFGSEDAGGYGGYSGGVYGDGGGFGGASGGFEDSSSRRDKYEEYDEYDEGAVAAPGKQQQSSSSSRSHARKESASRKSEPPKKKEPEVDLFSFGDDDVLTSSAPTASSSSNGKQPAKSGFDSLTSGGNDDDDFDDFQSATPVGGQSAPTAVHQNPLQALAPPPSTSTTTSQTHFAAPKPVSGSQAPNLAGLVGISSAPVSNTTTPANANYSAFSPPPLAAALATTSFSAAANPAPYQPSQPNYFTSVPVVPTQRSATSTSSTPSMTPAPMMGSANKPAAKAGAGGDAFGNIWSSASAGIKKTGTPSNSQGPNLASMAKEKASAGIWGSTTAAPAQQQQQQHQSQVGSGAQKIGGGLDDLLG